MCTLIVLSKFESVWISPHVSETEQTQGMQFSTQQRNDLKKKNNPAHPQKKGIRVAQLHSKMITYTKPGPLSVVLLPLHFGQKVCLKGWQELLHHQVT